MPNINIEDSELKLPNKNYLLIAIVIGFLIFLALTLYADIGNVVEAFSNFKWQYIPLILFLTLLNYLLRFLKWDYYLHMLNIHIGIKNSAEIFLSGLTMSITPAKLGEVFKSYLIKRLNNTAMSKSISIVFAERITDVIGLLILAAISFSAFQYGLEILVIVSAILIIMLVIIQSKKIFYKLLDITKHIPIINKYTKNIAVAYEGAYALFKPKPLLITMLISVISWGFECLAMYFVLKGFSVESSVSLGTFVFSFSSLAGTASMIPGGLLIAEGSSTGLLIIAGISKSIAASATVVIRICTLWFGVFIGLVTTYIIKDKYFKNHQE
jgi:uncharacterized protein (TIRG00374 family)